MVNKKSNRIRKIRETVLSVLEDGQVHSLDEFRAALAERNVALSKGDNALSNVVYKLKQSGRIASCEEKGCYKLCENERGENEIEEVKEGKAKICVDGGEEERKGKQVHLDPAEFVILSPLNSREPERKVTIEKNGEVKLNSALMKTLNTQRIALHYRKDLSTIVFDPNNELKLFFRKNGTMKNPEIAELLKKARIPFPAVYIVNWSEEYNAWTGTLQMDRKK